MKKMIAILGLAIPALANADIEKIMGYSIDDKGITFQVASNGGTQKENFILKQVEGKPVQLELHRETPDYCRGHGTHPYGVKILFTWQEISLENHTPFTIVNPNRELKRVKNYLGDDTLD